MSDEADNTTRSQLLWLGRTYAWLLVGCVLLGAVVLPAVGRLAPARYEATALVVISELHVSPQSLALFGESVFSTGVVADAVAADPEIGGDPDTLIPEHLRLVTGQDSVTYQVVGSAQDPARASRIANVAAAAFVQDLNRAGADLATFSLGLTARVPQQPVQQPSTVLLVGLGGTTGLALGAGLALLLLVLRRPVVDADTVAEATDAPLLSVLTLPTGRAGALPHPRRVVGTSALRRALSDRAVETVVVASAPRESRERRTVTAAVALLLGRRVHVDLFADRELVRTVTRWREAAYLPDPRPAHPERTVRLVDGADVLPERQGPEGTYVVLVVAEGCPRRQLQALVAATVLDEPFGVVLHRTRAERRWGRRRASVAPATAEPGPEPAPAAEPRELETLESHPGR